MGNELADIRYGHEVKISLGKWDSTQGVDGEWVYEVVEYRQGFNPNTPDDTQGVNDGLTYKGEKGVYAENDLTLSQTMPTDWDSGLFGWENMNGIIAKAEIVPEDGEAVTTGELYLTNLCTRNVQIDDIGNTGEFNISLNGRFDQRVTEEAVGNEDWVVDYGV